MTYQRTSGKYKLKRQETKDKIGKLTDSELSYFAGLFDGEGSIYINKFLNRNGDFRYKIACAIGMTDRRPIDWLLEKIGGNLSINKKLRNNAHNICYIWNINGINAGILIEEAKDKLLVKGEQAELLLEFIRTMGLPTGREKNSNNVGTPPISKEILEKRAELKIRLTELNRRGKLDE